MLENSTPVKSTGTPSDSLPTGTKRRTGSAISSVTNVLSGPPNGEANPREIEDSCDSWIAQFFKMANPSVGDIMFLLIMHDADLEHAELVAKAAEWDCQQARESVYRMIGKPLPSTE